MDPVSSEGKRRKLSVETIDLKHCATTEDRISNLPPELIGKLLSLVPTKQAVATSVLSFRWKSFWTFITRLECHDLGPDFRKTCFIRFMYRFLYCKTTSLDYFSVTGAVTDNISHVRAWVSAALRVDVKVLRLGLYISDSDAERYTHVLPFDLFSSKKLLSLTIDRHFIIDIPATVCLPSLQALLCPCGVRFRDNDSLKRLLLGCPALELLHLTNSTFGQPLVLPQELFSYRKLAKLHLFHGIILNVPTVVSLPSIQAIHLNGIIFPDNDSAKRLLCGCPSLQQLNITMGLLKLLHVNAPILSNLTVKLSGGGDEDVCSNIVLETPSLMYLKVEGMSADSYELTVLKQLVEAELDGLYFRPQYEAVTNLIMGISSVKTLSLSGSITRVIVESRCELPKFHRLTTLKLGVSNDVGWAFLPDLLENSPFLEMLVFERGLVAYSSQNANWRPPQKVPYCLLYHLRVIQINYFEGDIEENEMIQYFIQNRGALKDLTIQYSGGSGKLWDNINVAED